MGARIVTCVGLLRHGETAGSGRYCGSTDDVLTPRGWEQMRSVLDKDFTWERIVSSPLARCTAFARELAHRRGLPIEIEHRLQEYHFGAWEGKSAAELLVTNPERLARFWEDPARYPPPGGEDFIQFQTRVLEAWNELCVRHAGRRLLMIGHGGPIRVVVGQVRHLSWPERLRLDVPLASMNRVSIHCAATADAQTTNALTADP
ncbi:MAG: histidine phosphatase family protein [Sulfuricaulis sp.]